MRLLLHELTGGGPGVLLPLLSLHMMLLLLLAVVRIPHGNTTTLSHPACTCAPWRAALPHPARRAKVSRLVGLLMQKAGRTWVLPTAQGRCPMPLPRALPLPSPSPMPVPLPVSQP